jgi:hypothetical protein
MAANTRRRGGLRGGLIAGLFLIIPGAGAHPLPERAEGCDSIAEVPPRPEVDFLVDIQPQLALRCASCHTEISAGGFSVLAGQIKSTWLGEEESGAPSGFPGFRRVVPARPRDSLVFLRVHCENAGGPDNIIPRMPPGDRIEIALQALIHDWIANGAILRGATPGTRTDRQFMADFEPLR